MEVNDLVGLGKLSESTINALAKSIGPLLKPLATEIGQAISDPIRRIRFEREIQWYRRLEQAGCYIEAAGKAIHPVNPKILLPISEHSTLETDTYLQDLWSKLLASALVEEEIHPSFAEVLKQLTPLDAKVFLLIDTKTEDSKEHNEFTIFLELVSEFGASDLAEKIKGACSFPKSYDFTKDDEKLLLEKQRFIRESLENLQRLSLLDAVGKPMPSQSRLGYVILPWGAVGLHHSSFGFRFLKAINGPQSST